MRKCSYSYQIGMLRRGCAIVEPWQVSEMDLMRVGTESLTGNSRPMIDKFAQKVLTAELGLPQSSFASRPLYTLIDRREVSLATDVQSANIKGSIRMELSIFGFPKRKFWTL